MQIWLVLIFFRLEKTSNTIQSFYYSEPLAVNSPGISIVIKHLKIIKAKNTFPIRQHISRNTDKFSLWIFFFYVHFTTRNAQRRQLLMSLPRGGRDGCTSPSWNAPLPSLSVSVSPIHAGLYPALLYVSSYAHAPVLSLSLWHASLE